MKVAIIRIVKTVLCRYYCCFTVNFCYQAHGRIHCPFPQIIFLQNLNCDFVAVSGMAIHEA